MSGFEVIGVILGAWPVIMHAVDMYKAMKDHRGAERLRLELDTEEVIFSEFLHALLSSDVSDADLVKLSAQLNDRSKPNTDLWKDRVLQSKLEKRLGPGKTRVTLSSLVEMDKLLTSLRDQIARGDVDMKSTRSKIKARISHTNNSRTSSTFRHDLESLRLHNLQLRRLFEPCTSPCYTAWGEQPTSPPKGPDDIIELKRAYAKELYEAICDSYRCQCHFPHEANLGLRPDPPQLLEPFELIFPVKDISEDVSQLDIRCSSPDEISIPSTDRWDSDASHLSRRWSYSRYNSLTPSPPQAKRGHSVSFSNSQSDEENAGPIEDLCRFVKELEAPRASLSTQNSCLGILGAKEKKFTVQITSMEGGSLEEHSVVCLDDFLLPFTDWNLNRKTRMDLALGLSIAIRQFYSTPWIDAWWTWKDFCMRNDEKPQVFVNHKFYAAGDPRHGTARQNSHSLLTSTFWFVYGEPELTRLGFALVELALGKRLSQLRTSDADQNQDEDMLDLETAKNAVDSGLVLKETSKAYDDVAKACLNHQVLGPSETRSWALSSKNKTFHQDLEQFVVAPLRNYYSSQWPQEVVVAF